ncbi:hypothetical protein VTI74DRAFT_10712 [Chaetomium olivicolor]
MDRTFPLFPQFPPEIRQHIWRSALAQCWSVSQPRRVVGQAGGVKLVGTIHRAIGQACREARSVMQTTHTHVHGLGWIDFGRHLFFFRDAKADRGLMQQATDGLLAHIQHMALNPRDWVRLWYTVDVIKNRCTALRALIVVAPWFEPPAGALTAAGPESAAWEALDVAPYEDWGPLFRTTPTEVDVSALIDAIERPAANASRNAQYRARLDQAVQLLPGDIDQIDNAYGRTRAALQRLDQAVRTFAGVTPRLYLRTKNELLPSTTLPAAT